MGSLLKQFMAGVGGGNPWPSYWATQYKKRVEDDGGDVVLLDYIKNDLAKIDEIKEFDNLALGITAIGGLKTKNVGGSKVILKAYDLSINENDANMEVDANMPSYYGDFSFLLPSTINLTLDQSVGKKYLDHDPILNGNYTAFYVIKHIGGGAPIPIHSGHWLTNNEMAFCAHGGGFLTGPTIFRARPAPEIGRGSAEYPPVNNCRLLTFQPDHIYLNGTEVSYKSGYTASIQGNALKRLGARYDNVNNYMLGSIECAFVFNGLMSDEKRSSFETHLLSQYLNDDYTKSPLAPINSFTELTYTLLDKRDNHILGQEREGAKRMMYSDNDGVTWTYLTLAETSRMGHIFSNGNLFFATSGKVYKSEDGLNTIIEITPLDESGNAYSVSGNFTFSPFHQVDNQIYGEDEIILFGSYPGPHCIVWGSVNGNDCRIVLRFGEEYDYNANHIHICNYSPASGLWYITTGDSAGYHWLTLKYDGTWTVSYILAGADTDQTKAVSMQAVGNYLYWSADVTTGYTNRGIWRCHYADWGDKLKHDRIFGVNVEFSAILIDGDDLIFTSYYPNTLNIRREWEVYRYNMANGLFKRYYFVDPTLSRIGVTPYIFMKLSKHGGKYYGDIFYGSYNYNTIEFELD